MFDKENKVSTKTNLTLDIAIFSAFLVASNPALTGLAIHEWLGIFFSAALITHLLFHWDWIANLTKTFFKKLFHASRLNFVVDSLLFVAMTAAMLSGLMISKNVLPALGIQLDVSREWRSIHSLAADASLIFVALHFALHWKWVVSGVQRYIVAPLAGLVRRPATNTAAQFAAQPVKINDNK
jgi:hypothetical protein